MKGDYYRSCGYYLTDQLATAGWGYGVNRHAPLFFPGGLAKLLYNQRFKATRWMPTRAKMLL